MSDEQLLFAGMPRLYTIDEAAKLLRISPQYVRKLMKRKESPLKVTRLSPRRIRITEHSLLEFIASSTSEVGMEDPTDHTDPTAPTDTADTADDK